MKHRVFATRFGSWNKTLVWWRTLLSHT